MIQILLAAALLFLAACGSDKAECGGTINSGTLTGPVISNCANGDAGPGDAGPKTTTNNTTNNTGGTPQ